MGDRRTQVFISYSHRDDQWRERLQVHIKPFVRESTIEVWMTRNLQTTSKLQ